MEVCKERRKERERKRGTNARGEERKIEDVGKEK